MPTFISSGNSCQCSTTVLSFLSMLLFCASCAPLFALWICEIGVFGDENGVCSIPFVSNILCHGGLAGSPLNGILKQVVGAGKSEFILYMRSICANGFDTKEKPFGYLTSAES